jgi:hypothetical protein
LNECTTIINYDYVVIALDPIAVKMNVNVCYVNLITSALDQCECTLNVLNDAYIDLDP